MAISLEELRRQRAQIQQHLDWLDAKIAAAENQAAPALQPETRTEQPRPTERPEHAVNQTDPDVGPDTETSQFKAKTSEDLKRAKIGCVVLFVGATALFLFLLFGLPYLI